MGRGCPHRTGEGMVAVRKDGPCTGAQVDMMLTGVLQLLRPVLPPMACAWIM
jgi:hypothetical protein